MMNTSVSKITNNSDPIDFVNTKCGKVDQLQEAYQKSMSDVVLNIIVGKITPEIINC